MSDGIGCICCARDQSECGCDADWTPKEVYDLRDKIKQQQALIEQLVGALSEVQHIAALYQDETYHSEATKALLSAKEAGYDIESKEN